jgi:hypothetical protein
MFFKRTTGCKENYTLIDVESLCQLYNSTVSRGPPKLEPGSNASVQHLPRVSDDITFDITRFSAESRGILRPPRMKMILELGEE